MNSPKSVSVTSMPAASRAGLRWISSEVIDFDLTACLQPACRAMSTTICRASSARRRPSGPGRRSLLHRRFELFEVAVEMGERVLLDALGVIAELAAVGQGGVAAAVAGHQRVGQPHQGGLQRRVGQRLADAAEEVVMFVLGVVGHSGIV